MTQKGNSSDYSDMDPNWNQIELIVRKWANTPPPPALEEVCLKTVEKLSELLLKNVELGNIPNNQLVIQESAKYLAQAVAYAMKASVQLGLEYGEQDKHSERTWDYIEEKIKNAMPLFKAAALPVTIWRGVQINYFIQAKQMTMETATQLLDIYDTSVLTYQYQCFTIGITRQTTP
jgi:hypothetical protein